MVKTDRSMFHVSIATRQKYGNRIYHLDSIYTTLKEAESKIDWLRKRKYYVRMVKGARHYKTGKPGYYIYKSKDWGDKNAKN